MNERDFDEVTKWVIKVNDLGRKMDEIALSMHPSAWHEGLADLNDQYRKLAARQPKTEAAI